MNTQYKLLTNRKGYDGYFEVRYSLDKRGEL